MATTRSKVKTTITDAPQSAEVEELDPFDLAMEVFGGSENIKLQIYSIDDDGNEQYRKQLPWNAELHNLDWIRSRFGPGTYRLKFHDRNQRNRTRSKIVMIGPESIPAAPAPVVVNPASNEVTEILREQNKLMMAALLGRKEGGGEGATTDILVKFLEGNQALNNTLLTHALSRGDTSGPLFDALQRGLQLAGELKTEGEGGWLNVVRGLAKDMMPLIQQIAKQQAAAPPRPIPVETRPVTRPALTAPAGAPPPAETNVPEPAGPQLVHPQSEEEMANDNIRLFLGVTAPMIAEAAKRGETAETVADELLGEIGPNYYPLLAGLTVDQLVEAAPILGQHRGFVEQVLKAIQEAAKEEEKPDEDN